MRGVTRKPREDEAGAVQHAYGRGNEKRPIFRDDVDRRHFLKCLGLVVEATDWLCLGFCLMDNHFHLLIETPRPNLAEGMHRLQTAYAKWFNERHGRVGHLFQGRYGSKRMRSEAQLWTTAAYIARNPVEAGLCGDPADWRWSSHRFVLDGHAPKWLAVDRLLWHFGGVGGDPRSVYAALTTAV